MNSKEDELKETHTETHYNENLKRQAKRILKEAREKGVISYKGSSVGFLIRNVGGQRSAVRRGWGESHTNPTAGQAVLREGGRNEDIARCAEAEGFSVKWSSLRAPFSQRGFPLGSHPSSRLPGRQNRKEVLGKTKEGQESLTDFGFRRNQTTIKGRLARRTWSESHPMVIIFEYFESTIMETGSFLSCTEGSIGPRDHGGPRRDRERSQLSKPIP